MFVPCRSCRRHVRAGDAACPFCTAPLEATVVASTPIDAVRASRAVLAAAAALGVALAGCHEHRRIAPVYGGPPTPTTEPTEPTTEDAGTIEPGPGPAPTSSGSTATNGEATMPTTEPPPSLPGDVDAAVPSPTTIPSPPGKPVPGPPIALYGAPPPPTP